MISHDSNGKRLRRQSGHEHSGSSGDDQIPRQIDICIHSPPEPL